MTEDHYKNSEAYVRDMADLIVSDPEFVQKDIIPLVQRIGNSVAEFQELLNVVDDGPHERPMGLVVELGATIINHAKGIGDMITNDDRFDESTIYLYLKDTAEMIASLKEFLERNAEAIRIDPASRAHCVRVVNRCLIHADVMYILNSIIALMHAEDEIELSDEPLDPA